MRRGGCMALMAFALVGVLAAAELQLEDFASRAGWVVAPGDEDELTAKIRSSGSTWKGSAELEVCDADGKRLQVQSQPCVIAADGIGTLKFRIKFAKKTGERLMRLRLYEKLAHDSPTRLAEERSLMVAGADCAFIIFNREPVARGMEFVRERCGPKGIVTRGYKRTVWEPHYGSHEQGWWRSLRMNLTDKAFQQGAAPVVDVQVRFRQPAEAPVNISLDGTKGGFYANGWGGRGEGYVKDPPLKLLEAKVDDAVFAHSQRNPAEPGWANGCDLRFNVCNAGEIRSIVVRRYAMTENVDWRRMVRHVGVALAADGKSLVNFVATPGAKVEARLRFANRAGVPFAGKARLSLRTAYDAPVWERESPVSLSARSEDAIAVPIDTTGLRKGVYVLRSEIAGLITTETLFAVCDKEKIPFAKPGDFLYGSGVGGTWKDGYRLDWAEFMGVDLIRNCVRDERQDSRDNLNAAIAELKRRGFPCGHLIMDPPYRQNAEERQKAIASACEFLRWAASAHRDWLKYFEMGNEPDLTFFYPGSPAEYVTGMTALARAVKQGNQAAVTMNGGLCFHGADGWRRAHEIVKSTPDNLLDAWAYHGHGIGANAERNAWERQLRAVKDGGKKIMPFIETESGMFASDPATWRRQAQTAVEKIVYAQSKGAPTFLWFNIHMYGGDWGYTTVEREHEPRPAVLAFRTMTKRLKGLRFVKTLDLLAPEAEAYCFAAPDGRRALVLWSDRGVVTRTVSLGAPVAEATVYDLYDNPEKATMVTLGLVQVTVGSDPAFVVWRATNPMTEVTLPKPLLALPTELPLVPGRPAGWVATVRNPTDAELGGELKLSLMGNAPIGFTAPVIPVRVPGGGEARVNVKFEVKNVAASFWPRQWQVFLPVSGDVDLTQFTSIPKEVEGNKGKVQGRVGFVAKDGMLDLGAINGGFAEKMQALCFAEVEAPRDMEAECGASADWWMQWFVNGKEAFSTLDRGNGGPQGVLTHRFKMHLRQGRNLLAVRVLSGSDGWKFYAGGPDEVAAEERARTGNRDGVRVEFIADGKVLGRESLPTRLLRPLDRAEPGLEGTPDKWDALAPDFIIEDHVINVFAAVPDDTRHWHGKDDFSGKVWLRDIGGQMLVMVKVRDDVAKAGDGVKVRVALPGNATVIKEFIAKGVRNDSAKTTAYVVTVPKKELGHERFAISVRIEDDDWGELKQYAAWGSGTDGVDWFQTWCR